VVLAGGSTRIPKIQALVADFFEGVEIVKNIGPDVCIAFGAAIQASYISNADSNKLQVQFLYVCVCLCLHVCVAFDAAIQTSSISNADSDDLQVQFLYVSAYMYMCVCICMFMCVYVRMYV